MQNVSITNELKLISLSVFDNLIHDISVVFSVVASIKQSVKCLGFAVRGKANVIIF